MSDIKTELTAAAVEEVFLDCLFKEGEPTEGYVVGEGVAVKIGFHPERLASHKEEIEGFLSQLPTEFHEGGGGGSSFLNACMDKDGRQWGEHRSIDQLLILALASELVRYLFPREMWGALYGGMPYFVILDPK